jgi:cadmium resistance protein CadD (predicted permease)
MICDDATSGFELLWRRGQYVTNHQGSYFYAFLLPSKVERVYTVLGVIVVGSLAFVGTMLDNFFAFASQLSLTEHARFQRISVAHALGVAILVVLAAGVGTLLTAVPLRWVGFLCVAPFALAAHAWRQRKVPASGQDRRGAVTTFTVCLALGGDNIAVWIPVLRANGSWHEILIIIVFALWEALFIAGARAIAGHPRVVAFGGKYGRALVPWVYLGLGVLILFECGTLR